MNVHHPATSVYHQIINKQNIPYFLSFSPSPSLSHSLSLSLSLPLSPFSFLSLCRADLKRPPTYSLIPGETLADFVLFVLCALALVIPPSLYFCRLLQIGSALSLSPTLRALSL